MIPHTRLPFNANAIPLPQSCAPIPSASPAPRTPGRRWRENYMGRSGEERMRRGRRERDG
ncbi:hypothetical protein BDN71DRAFT_1593273, partial [Pleurotus eryngii]